MNYRFVAIFLLSVLPLVGFSQSPQHYQDANVTRGECSPIAVANQGSITIKCTGFSAEQNKQILDILRKISQKQAGDQEQVLLKLNEVLETVRATQKLSSPRVISEQERHMALNSAWGRCGIENVQIIAPTNDSEAQALAVQIQEILRQAGMNAAMTYDVLEKLDGNTEDFKIVYSSYYDCTARYLSGALRNTLHIGFEKSKNQLPPPSSMPLEVITTRIYVYRR